MNFKISYLHWTDKYEPIVSQNQNENFKINIQGHCCGPVL